MKPITNRDIALTMVKKGLPLSAWNDYEVNEAYPLDKRLPRKRVTAVLEMGERHCYYANVDDIPDVKTPYGAIYDRVAYIRHTHNGKTRYQESGVDYGAPLEKVYQVGNMWLVKAGGHTGWSGVGMTEGYAPTYMIWKILKTEDHSILFHKLCSTEWLWAGETSKVRMLDTVFAMKCWMERNKDVNKS